MGCFTNNQLSKNFHLSMASYVDSNQSIFLHRSHPLEILKQYFSRFFSEEREESVLRFKARYIFRFSVPFVFVDQSTDLNLMGFLLGRIRFLGRLGRIRFLARFRVFTVFVISIISLRKAVIITVASRHICFLFGLNNTSLNSKLNCKGSENVKIIGRGLVWQATGTAGVSYEI